MPAATQRQGPQRLVLQWQRVPLPALDERRCTGCGGCVAICPTYCLEMDGPLPWLPRPLDCIRCAACAFVCPTAAITVPESATS